MEDTESPFQWKSIKFKMYQPLTIPVFFSVKKSFPTPEACNNEK